MKPSSAVLHRREFLERAVGLAAGGLASLTPSFAPLPLLADEPRPAAGAPSAPVHPVTVIAGTPRERGRAYGRAFAEGIRAFLKREILEAFRGRPSTREEMLRYAGLCAGEVRAYSPLIFDEIEGMAEGSGLSVEDLVLITLHEELWHRGVLPKVQHCTAIAAGPPDTADGETYVGQTWDWMGSVYGLSSLLLWKRTEGPSLLAYSYPGLWVGAGLSSAGLALTWTSGDGMGIPGPRVGIPSYVLIAQILYQDSLRGALSEARRARNAGWFTFVIGDGEGRLVNVEGTPRELVVEEAEGRLSRVGYGSREMTRTPEGREAPVHARCRRMARLLEPRKGTLDRGALQAALADHGAPEDRASAVCVHGSTLDAMLFNTTRRKAYLTRGPTCSDRWKSFGFDPPERSL